MQRHTEDPAVELVGGVRAVRAVAHEVVGGQLAKGTARLKASSKTRKSTETRRRIMGAASHLMVERGNTDFQMSEVSDRCEMSKGSLYYYFSDKNELVAAIFDESVDELVEAIESVARNASTAREALRELYAEFSRRMRSGSPLALALTYELASPTGASMYEVNSRFSRAARVIAEQLERAKGEGAVRNEVDSELAAVFVTGAFLATSLKVVSGGMDEDVDALAAHLADLTLHGVGEKGVTLA